MTRALVKPCISVTVALLLATLCSGCTGGRSYSKHEFVLEVTRPAQPARQPLEVLLAVRDFTIDPVYGGRGLAYRKSESEYETDFYNEFLIAPHILLSSQTRRWLSRSGMFRTVLEPGSLVGPTHILEGNVQVLHGDFRSQNPPQAVIQIRIFLVASKGLQPEIVFTRDYQASQEAEAPTASALVAAFDRCLEQVLSALEEDLDRALSPAGPS